MSPVTSRTEFFDCPCFFGCLLLLWVMYKKLGKLPGKGGGCQVGS